MAHHDGAFGPLFFTVILLAAAVIIVPIARSLRLSAVVGYLFAGMLIGPFGLEIVRTPESILAIAELGVVLLLFLIGLDLEFSKLLKMRRDIFGLGAAQFFVTAAAIGGIAVVTGLLPWRAAIVAGLALALSATSVALKILEERGHLQHTYGQRAFAILLFQDMAVVPLLALLPLLAPGGAPATGDLSATFSHVALMGAAIGAVVIAGRYLLNPLFRLLARSGAREVMTAAALLIVLGTGLLMQAVGMSMALGAFLAGVMLAESNYRHELEADVEPFRGLLLALFFMGIGIGINFTLVYANLWLILIAALFLTVLKAGIVWALFRATCTTDAAALRAGSILTGAGEFAFVLLPLGASFAILSNEHANVLTAIAAVSLLIGPPVATVTDFLLDRYAPRHEPEAANFEDARGSVLLIGFGRFGQFVSQCLLAEGIDVTIIDNDPEMIENAATFGFKIYYGDGTRLDVLRAAGAGDARLISVCVDRKQAANRIVDLVHADFPDAKLHVRSYDRGHTLELLAKGVDYEIRETYESALMFGRETLVALGVDPEHAKDVEESVRRRDLERLALQQVGGLYAGIDLIAGPTPEPLTTPSRGARALNPEAEEIIHPTQQPAS